MLILKQRSEVAEHLTFFAGVARDPEWRTVPPMVLTGTRLHELADARSKNGVHQLPPRNLKQLVLNGQDDVFTNS